MDWFWSQLFEKNAKKLDWTRPECTICSTGVLTLDLSLAASAGVRNWVSVVSCERVELFLLRGHSVIVLSDGQVVESLLCPV
jgi:hypothetical protein